GLYIQDIMAELGRSESCVIRQLSRLGLRRKGQPKFIPVAQNVCRPRKCLSCGETFLSEHSGNRICQKCRNQQRRDGALLDDFHVFL
ncbi:MAG: hypothetical protein LBO00_07570, partial [Zoogloeaceae bacterium]|nr:hypothetical protein [Zoogloeaceae bacterium]